jgi:hypothetical protein
MMSTCGLAPVAASGRQASNGDSNADRRNSGRSNRFANADNDEV